MTQHSSAFSIEDIIKGATLNLLIHKPFLGFVVQKMNIIEDKKSPLGSIGTAATDGRNIYYNEQFFRNMTPKNRVFVIGHEVLHCVLDTFGRKHDRDMAYWNMATDYVINDVLKTEQVGEMPSMGLYDPKYHGWAAEEVYEDLVKKKAAKKNTLDVHLKIKMPGDNKEDAGSGNKDDQSDSGPSVTLSQEELDQLSEDMKHIVIEAYQRSKIAGNQMASIDKLVGELLTPKINWRQLLVESIQSIFRSDMDWSRPNRRSLNRNVLLPSARMENSVSLCVAIDTSGSISDQQRIEFLSEIAGILQYYRSFDLTIWCFDTDVHAVEHYDQSTITDISEYVGGGGGGTDIACNYRYMKEQGIKPKQFICMTDGFNGSDWGDPDYCPSTFIIHSNPKPQVPFGRWALYEDLVQGK